MPAVLPRGRPPGPPPTSAFTQNDAKVIVQLLQTRVAPQNLVEATQVLQPLIERFAAFCDERFAPHPVAPVAPVKPPKAPEKEETDPGETAPTA